MPDLSAYKVDLDTPQPNGGRGESPRAAFTKYNDALDALRGVVEHIGNTPPPNPLPYMQWIDTSVEPVMLRRRSADNTAWVELGPALKMFGELAYMSVEDLGLGTAASASLDALLTKAGNLAGVADPATARSNLGLGSAALRASIGTGALYGRDSIVGTVSQSGGVPTGAVIERGANANGEYVRFADGTQICTRILTMPAWSLGTSVAVTWTYPASFGTGQVYVSTVLRTITPHVRNSSGISDGWVSAAVWAGGDASPAGELVYATAIGRWF